MSITPGRNSHEFPLLGLGLLLVLLTLHFVDFLPLSEVGIVQFLSSGENEALVVKKRHVTMFASLFAVETALSFSSTFSSGSVISVKFVSGHAR